MLPREIGKTDNVLTTQLANTFCGWWWTTSGDVRLITLNTSSKICGRWVFPLYRDYRGLHFAVIPRIVYNSPLSHGRHIVPGEAALVQCLSLFHAQQPPACIRLTKWFHVDSICSIIEHVWCQNMVRTKNVTHRLLKWVSLMSFNTTFWCLLWSITEQIHVNMHYRQRFINKLL